MSTKTVVDFIVVTLAEDYIIRMRKDETELRARKRGHKLGSWREVANKPSNLIAQCTLPSCGAYGLVDRAHDAMNDTLGTACHTKCPLARKG